MTFLTCILPTSACLYLQGYMATDAGLFDRQYRLDWNCRCKTSLALKLDVASLPGHCSPLQMADPKQTINANQSVDFVEMPVYLSPSYYCAGDCFSHNRTSSPSQRPRSVHCETPPTPPQRTVRNLPCQRNTLTLWRVRSPGYPTCLAKQPVTSQE